MCLKKWHNQITWSRTRTFWVSLGSGSFPYPVVVWICVKEKLLWIKVLYIISILSIELFDPLGTYKEIFLNRRSLLTGAAHLSFMPCRKPQLGDESGWSHISRGSAVHGKTQTALQIHRTSAQDDQQDRQKRRWSSSSSSSQKLYHYFAQNAWLLLKSSCWQFINEYFCHISIAK